MAAEILEKSPKEMIAAREEPSPYLFHQIFYISKRRAEYLSIYYYLQKILYVIFCMIHEFTYIMDRKIHPCN